MSQSAKTVDLMVNARWVVPVVPSGAVLEHHSVVVDQGRIVDLCPTELAGDRYAPRQIQDCPDHLITPGLINAHGHAAMSLFRGMADDLPLMSWLEDHIWPAEAAFVDDAFIADGTRLAMAEMLRTGTTLFSDQYFFPEVVAELAQHQGMRVQVCFPVLDFPTNWGSGPEEYLHKGVELFKKYRNSELVQVAFGPHAPYTVSDEPLQKIVTLAHQLDAPIQIHLHETAFEVSDALSKTGVRPTRRLAELGLLTPSTQCVHMTQIDDEDVDILTSSGAHVIHCPESNLKLASGFCPVHRLMEAGVNVALGTDGAASNNDLDMIGEMRTAALLAKGVSGEATALNAHQTLAMATLHGARALGLDEQLGSLEPGKQADLIAINLSDLCLQPVYDPVSHLVYSSNGRRVSHVWIHGECQLKDGQLQRLDLHQLRHRVQEWHQRIQNR